LVCLLSCVSGCEDDEPIDLEGTGGSGTGGAATGGSSGASTGGSGGTAGTATGGSAGIAGSGSGGVAGSAGASGASGAAGGGGVAGGTSACNYLTQLGTAITGTISAAQPPPATGGVLVDGFYKLSSAKLYGGATGTTFWRTLKIEVGTTELKTVERDGASTIDKTTTGTYTLSGHELTRSLTCPTTGSAAFDYSAPAGKFIAYESQGGTKVVELTYDYDGAI
jgi:hypothetical protein